MAASITCTRVIRRNGRVYVNWSDKTQNEFTSLEDARAFVRDTLSKDSLRAMLIAKYLHVDPTAANPSLLEGRTITADPDAAANLVRVT